MDHRFSCHKAYIRISWDVGKNAGLNTKKVNVKSQVSPLVFLVRDLVVRCSDQCGCGAAVALFKVANGALKNKQIS